MTNRTKKMVDAKLILAQLGVAGVAELSRPTCYKLMRDYGYRWNIARQRWLLKQEGS